MDIGNPDFNMYDMVQGYCAELAAVDGGKSHTVNLVCSNCKSEHHPVEDCLKMKQTQANEANRLKNAKFNGKEQMQQKMQIIKCHCGEVGIGCAHYKPLLQQAKLDMTQAQGS